MLSGFSQSVATELAAQGSPCCLLKPAKVTADPSNHTADSQHIAISTKTNIVTNAPAVTKKPFQLKPSFHLDIPVQLLTLKTASRVI